MKYKYQDRIEDWKLFNKQHAEPSNTAAVALLVVTLTLLVCAVLVIGGYIHLN